VDDHLDSGFAIPNGSAELKRSEFFLAYVFLFGRRPIFMSWLITERPRKNLASRGDRGFSRYPNAFFEDFFNNFLTEWPATSGGTVGTIALDVEETNDAYLVRANIPGVDRKNIDLTLDDNVLTISTKMAGETEEKEGKNFLYKERWEGISSRSVTLPLSVNSDEISAQLNNGVLEIRVAKRPEAKQKKIPVA
jgi:HSP20 family protein